MKSYVKLFILMLFLIPVTTCAVNQRVELRGVTGQLLPNPSYTFFDVQKKGYSVTFYYSAMKATKDLDGSYQYQVVEFLPINETNILPEMKYQKLVLTLDVSNDQLRTYRITEISETVFTDGREIKSYRDVMSSQLQFRSLNVVLPLRKVKSSKVMLQFYDDEGKMIFQLGDFIYTMKPKEEVIK